MGAPPEAARANSERREVRRLEAIGRRQDVALTLSAIERSLSETGSGTRDDADRLVASLPDSVRARVERVVGQYREREAVAVREEAALRDAVGAALVRPPDRVLSMLREELRAMGATRVDAYEIFAGRARHGVEMVGFIGNRLFRVGISLPEQVS